jgi:peptide-methionine (S)-S-oxide reductase
MQKCYLALGCFWKPEETFRSIKGVIGTEVGYAGGKNKKVTYEEICTGNTGHAETVKITFDENFISFEKILEFFFNIHDPTQKNMQYPDVGTQYRSEIFYVNEKQKKSAEKYKKLFSEKISGKIETNITEIKNYCKAEEYHQKYIMKRGH